MPIACEECENRWVAGWYHFTCRWDAIRENDRRRIKVQLLFWVGNTAVNKFRKPEANGKDSVDDSFISLKSSKLNRKSRVTTTLSMKKLESNTVFSESNDHYIVDVRLVFSRRVQRFPPILLSWSINFIHHIRPTCEDVDEQRRRRWRHFLYNVWCIYITWRAWLSYAWSRTARPFLRFSIKNCTVLVDSLINIYTCLVVRKKYFQCSIFLNQDI